MSGGQPDISKLQLHEFVASKNHPASVDPHSGAEIPPSRPVPASASAHSHLSAAYRRSATPESHGDSPKSAANSPKLSTSPFKSGANHTFPWTRSRSPSTRGPGPNSPESSGFTPKIGSPLANGVSRPNSPKPAVPSNRSSTSLSSEASTTSQRSGVNSGNSTGNSKNFLGKSSSILELKRFFGKGHTKHNQGVSPSSVRDPRGNSEPKKSAFSLFSLGKRSRKGTPVNLTPSVSPTHHHHHNHHHHHHHHSSDHPAALDPNQDLKNAVDPAYIDPRHLDPHNQSLAIDLVTHDPGYEGDWDPFHVFGLEPNSEHMPFLESGITKYGQMGRDMGSGAGGSVRMMARASDKKMFAVKEFRPRRTNESLQKYAKHVTAEYALGAALHHKNIIETIDLLKENDRYYEIMEYGPYDYFELVMSGQMSTMQINSAFKQIVNGVAYLHSMGVAHRDLKLDNCVVTVDGVVKLIDFGSAIIFKYPMSSQIHLARGILGSDPYLAPEVFLRQPYQPQIADIWSCGIIYCCSYLRRFPWKLPQDSDPGYKRFVTNPENVDGKHPPQDNPRKITGPWRLLRLLPNDTREVIQRVLQIDVEARITMNELTHSYWLSKTEEISVLPENYHQAG